MPRGLDDKFNHKWSECLWNLVSIIAQQIPLSTLLVLLKKFIYQQATHLKAMLWANYVHNSAILNFYLLRYHFHGTRYILRLKEALQVGKITFLHDHGRSLLRKLELCRKLWYHWIEVLVNALIQFVQSLVDDEYFMQLYTIFALYILPKALL